MKRKGKGSGKSVVMTILIAMPILTLALCLLCAKLLLSGKVGEAQVPMLCSVIAGFVSFLLSFYAARRMPQKKFMWGMATALCYGCVLLLGNLLFFGVAYGGLSGVLLPIIGAGCVASLLGAGKRRKFA